MRESASFSNIASVSEYLEALKNSDKFGPQVVCHRAFGEETGEYKRLPVELHPDLTDHLKNQGIHSLYKHQAQAFELISKGKDLLAATPTSSGKSLIYNLPVLNSIFSNPGTHALYLFPLKALAQDQLRILKQFEATLNRVTKSRSRSLAEIYDGDTSSYLRKKIRNAPSEIIISNPDMLHLSFLPYHTSWSQFFKKLKYIIIDEVHTYRGVFGSHMAWVLRRLQRILKVYGVDPVYIMLSATIGNPETLGQLLINRPVISLTESFAPRAKRNMLFLNPWNSAAHTASQLLEASLKRGLRTIVYTGSRKMTELISIWTRPRMKELANKLSSYRSGFLPEERRKIERKLSSGELLGVISTSALELGIDIGNLDICILVGYPGSVMTTWQRGGRVGRGGQESAIILVAGEDALDQFFMKNPDKFFDREMESAILNPLNPEIMEQHLHCAAAERPLDKKEVFLLPREAQNVLQKMTWNGILLQGYDGEEWFATRKFPQRLVNLRGGGKLLQIISQDNGEIIGSIDGGRALKECHPGAVYLQFAKTWCVHKCDIENGEVIIFPFNQNYHTRPTSEKNTEILEVFDRKTFAGFGICYGQLLIREKVSGYQKRNNRTNKLIATIPLDLPEQQFQTVGIWLEVPGDTQNEMEDNQLHFMGALHALEHAMIGMFPLMILCDRNDIGGISCPVHFQTAGAVVFVYDGHPGGIGLCSGAFHKIEHLLKQTEQTIALCDCENGCPSCVHSPKCGSGNRPIDKDACLVLVRLLRNPDHNRFGLKSFKELSLTKKQKSGTRIAESKKIDFDSTWLQTHYGVFDLETKYSAQQVGGWHKAHKMGISVAVVYDSLLDDYVVYLEDEIDKLVEHLFQLDLVIGFNNRRFDNSVLSAYTKQNLHNLATLDLLEIIHQRLGYRLSLDRLAQTTLGAEKSADGLQALEWYKQGEIEKICQYCKKDVAITRDLMLYGLKNGYFLFRNKAGSIVRLPVDLKTAIYKETKKAE
jgi:DEAD/DEAH box helicase domain-containing protein